MLSAGGGVVHGDGRYDDRVFMFDLATTSDTALAPRIWGVRA
jgi:hypothetical protein